MAPYKVVITDHSFPEVSVERKLIEAAGGSLEVASCKTDEDVIAAARDADALLVQWAPITERVLRSLPRCKVVIRYGIGVGRPGFEWSGVKTISRKAEWPDWTPPPEMMLRRPDLPAHMVGGPGNPLGARALYLGSSMYRIHGTNEPTTIGQNLSSGCIRMMNEDVIDLYDRVPVGTKVIVI